jgi:hypothetical protein
MTQPSDDRHEKTHHRRRNGVGKQVRPGLLPQDVDHRLGACSRDTPRPAPRSQPPPPTHTHTHICHRKVSRRGHMKRQHARGLARVPAVYPPVAPPMALPKVELMIWCKHTSQTQSHWWLQSAAGRSTTHEPTRTQCEKKPAEWSAKPDGNRGWRAQALQTLKAR